MTYRLEITRTGWRILWHGREIMGGSFASVRQARKALAELNRRLA